MDSLAASKWGATLPERGGAVFGLASKEQVQQQEQEEEQLDEQLSAHKNVFDFKCKCVHYTYLRTERVYVLINCATSLKANKVSF